MGKISEIFSDATTLEINSVLVDGISGRKMPGIRIAYLETLTAWAGQFQKLIRDLERLGLTFPGNKTSLAADAWQSEKARFNQGHYKHSEDRKLLEGLLDAKAAESFQDTLSAALGRRKDAGEWMAEMHRLIKVQGRLAALKSDLEEDYLKKDAVPQGEVLASRVMQALRKLWELKDGYIFAQNVVQLDGDIISRTNRRIYRDPQAKAHVEHLMTFHNQNVDAGIKHWHFLIDTIFSIAGAIGEKIANPFK